MLSTIDRAMDVDRLPRERAMKVAHALALDTLNQCVSECNFTYDALGAAMGLEKSYVWKVLHDEKPLRLDFLSALPPDVHKLFIQRRAEAFGLMVIEPMQGERALRALASAVVGLFTSGALKVAC